MSANLIKEHGNGERGSWRCYAIRPCDMTFVKTLCQMETEPRIGISIRTWLADDDRRMWEIAELADKPLIVGPTDASLNIAKHRCS